MKFVLLSGIHNDKNGTFHPGDVIEAETDLAERDPARFIAYDPADDDPEPAEKEE